MDQKMSSWGYKFEQYMQTDVPTSQKAQVNCSSHLRHILRKPSLIPNA